LAVDAISSPTTPSGESGKKDPAQDMTDLTLHELKPDDPERLDALLRQEAGRMFGSTPERIDPLPPKDRKPRIQEGLLAFLTPFRKLFHIS
jgi:hypothetical protein